MSRSDQDTPNGRDGADAPGRREDFPRPLTRRRLVPALLAATAALACIPFAVPIYQAIQPLLSHLPLNSFFDTLNQFPSAASIFLILAAIAILQPRRRATIVVFLVALLLSSTINEVIKDTTARARPRYSVAMGHAEKKWITAYLAQHPDAGLRPRRTDQWLGLRRHRPYFKDGYRSFPSGHANTSFVMAAFLDALYPEARILWTIAAAGCAAARVEKERHWPDDTLFGGALGWLVAQLVFSWRWPMRLGRLIAGLSRGRRRTRAANEDAESLVPHPAVNPE